MLVLALVVLLAACEGKKPKDVPDLEWVPNSMKTNLTLPFLEVEQADTSGQPVVSFCTRTGKDRGVDGQYCYPLFVVVNICRKQIGDVDKLMNKLLQGTYNAKDWDEADYETTCLDYNLTWPHCVSKKGKEKLCQLWKKLPPFERKYLSLFYGNHHGHHHPHPMAPRRL